jgi:hypothetical protein
VNSTSVRCLPFRPRFSPLCLPPEGVPAGQHIPGPVPPVAHPLQTPAHRGFTHLHILSGFQMVPQQRQSLALGLVDILGGIGVHYFLHHLLYRLQVSCGTTRVGLVCLSLAQGIGTRYPQPSGPSVDALSCYGQPLCHCYGGFSLIQPQQTLCSANHPSIPSRRAKCWSSCL